MNLLLDELPEYLEVAGKPYKIRTDFRTWIRIENVLFWDDADWLERVAKAIYLCFVNEFPDNFDAAARAVLEFYSCTGSEKMESAVQSESAEKEKKSTGWHNRVYSFNYDAGLIFAAFMSQYGIDIQTADMHWWKFNAMFSALSEGNKICKVMEYRSADLSGIKDKELKSFYRRMKRVYRLPDPRSEEEKEAAMAEVLAVAF